VEFHLGFQTGAIVGIQKEATRFGFGPFTQAAPAKAVFSFDPTCRVLTTLGKTFDAISFIGGGLPLFEESTGPWGPGIYDRSHPDWLERNLHLWQTVQGWAQCVQERKWREEDDIDDDECPYGEGNDVWMAFYYTVTMDLPFDPGQSARRSKIWKHAARWWHQGTWNEQLRKDISAFFKWILALLRGNKERVNEFLEEDMIKEPSDLPEDKIKMWDMLLAIYCNKDQGLIDFHHTVWECQRGRTFFVTKTGWIGTVEGMIQEDDVVVLLAGLEMPIILRPVEDRFRVVGPAYVHGMMDGVQWPKTPNELNLISLV
jgi:hypothetical protein